MAWCDTCIATIDDDLIASDGACPTCGSILTAPERRPPSAKFWIFIGGTALYLTWRIVQLVSWLSQP